MDKNKRIMKVMMNRAGGNSGGCSYNYRISLPSAWMNSMGVNPFCSDEDRLMVMEYDYAKDQIIIRRKKDCDDE